MHACCVRLCSVPFCSFQGVHDMCTGMPRMCSKTSPSRGENCHENIASGIWKFRVGVMTSEDKLVCLAREWYRAEPDRYLDLHIRACSGSQIGIGFKIKYSVV